MKKTGLQIYDASAGSGKTYALVKNYLQQLLSSPWNDGFKHLLAITFTNKAVAEMKTRIIDRLRSFTTRPLAADDPMFHEIVKNLGANAKEVSERSKKLLKAILHDYAFFDISTIDAFNHRLIRTFARDLKLPANFEVTLDVDAVLKRTVDTLIDNAGNDVRLTEVLVAFALEKANEDKSWDIARDLNDIAKLLKSENELAHLSRFEEKSIADFLELKSSLKKNITDTEKKVVASAQQVLASIHESGLAFEDFTRKTLPNHFAKVSKRQFDKLYTNNLQQDIEEGRVYNKTLPEGKKAIVDNLLPTIKAQYIAIKASITRLTLLKNFYKSIIPLSVLNLLRHTLSQLTEQENILLISDFNKIISKTIKGQPAPFIYERLGERYRHYFIDEFQDTSVMQWENLKPLIDHALTSENNAGEHGSLLLVGDAKQSIYRWRGGRAEQFLEMLGDKDPFFVDKQIERLPYNRRSFTEVVQFNNTLYSFIANELKDRSHRSLYENASQEVTGDKQGGCVCVSFIEAKNKSEEHERYPEKVIEVVKGCLEQGFALGDICILTRKNEEGTAIADALTAANIPLVSSETLLLKNVEEVQYLVDMLTYLSHPSDLHAKANALYYISKSLDIEDTHGFLGKHVHLEDDSFYDALDVMGISFTPTVFFQLSLFEAVEYLARASGLLEVPDAYVQEFLEFVFRTSQKKNNDIITLLDHWESEKETLSLTLSQSAEALQIMTIHKAKGLEFPVVIFPFANQSLTVKKGSHVWLPVDPKKYHGFDEVYVPFGDYVKDLGQDGQAVYEEVTQQAAFDNINLLYVATTRAIEQLYVIGKKPSARSITYSTLLVDLLKMQGVWNDDQSAYYFGTPAKVSASNDKIATANLLSQMISVPKEAHEISILTKNGLLWDSAKMQAIERGNLVHELMSKVFKKEDVKKVVDNATSDGFFSVEESVAIKQALVDVVSHHGLRMFFSDDFKIYNEREIITSEGNMLRPDKIAVKDHEAAVIDYKTGLHSKKYELQMNEYASALKAMGYRSVKKLLVFIGEDITVRSI